MPTNNFNRTAGLLPLRALPLLGAQYPRPNPHIISTMSPQCASGNAFHTQNWGAQASAGTNVGVIYPFVIAHPFLVRKVFWVNGTTITSTSADVAVYDASLGRLVSGGGTALSGANAAQEVDVTDTLLRPGLYYLAYSQNSNSGTPVSLALAVSSMRSFGSAQMASAYPLPSTYTPTAHSNTTAAKIVLCGVASRTLAA